MCAAPRFEDGQGYAKCDHSDLVPLHFLVASITSARSSPWLVPPSHLLGLRGLDGVSPYLSVDIFLRKKSRSSDGGLVGRIPRLARHPA